MSLVVAKALWSAGWFLSEIAIPVAVGVGLCSFILARAAHGWIQSWRKT